MNKPASVFLTLVTLLIGLSGCATGGSEAVWTTLLDGDRGLENFNRVGEANWTATDDVIQATQSPSGSSHLVSKNSYKDFILRVEFWSSDQRINVKGKHTKEGVQLSWTYADDVPNESLRSQIGGYMEDYPDSYGKGQWTAETTEDARQMAIDFAEGVS